jgi:hypothetical protein
VQVDSTGDTIDFMLFPKRDLLDAAPNDDVVQRQAAFHHYFFQISSRSR